MKFFAGCLTLFYFLVCSTWNNSKAQCNNIPPKALLSGNTCQQSTLTVQSDQIPNSISWIKDGQIVATEYAYFTTTGTTVAGNATGISGNGINQLSYPDRICVDEAGNIYVPDLGNNRIQKWSPGATAGVTVAGGNGSGSALNQFNRPTSVAVDVQGNIYVTDQNNNRIQKWTPGATEGVTIANDITQPTDIFVDKQGNVYASDQTNRLVKKWAPGNPNGMVVVNGSASMYSVTGIFVDEQGFVYACDTDNNRVFKWTPGAASGTVVAGGNGYGSAANQLANPLEIYVDCEGNVYIADYNNHRIQKWAPGAGTGTTVFGTGLPGSASNQLENPIGVYVDKDLNIYISEFENHRVQKISHSIKNSFLAASSGVYSAMVYTSCCSVNAGTITIEPIKNPAVAITSSATSICEGMLVNFTASPTDEGAQPFFQWMKNGLSIGGNTPLLTIADLKNGDIISCVLTSSEQCASTATVTSNSIVITVSKSGDIEIGDQIGICPEQEIILTVPAGYTVYEWQDGSNGISHNVSDKGLYWIKVQDACGNWFADSATVFIHPLSDHFLPADFFICSYDRIPVSSSVGFSSYQWNTGSNSPSVIISEPGRYWLEGIDANNCLNRDTVLVSLKSCPPKGIYVPKAFTPQNDGLNDIFKPIVAGQLLQYEFYVYNRYGQIVFNTKDPAKGWDGNLKGVRQDANVFVWFCRYQLDGGEAKVEKGTVLLVR